MEKQILLGSLFDGIGAFPYAASFFGIKTLWASEIFPQAISVTKKHLPEMNHLGDITKLNGAELPPVDIVTFGSPCQGLSVSGRRLGLADERSALFSEAIRIIFEMREATNGQYPRYAIWENVPGALSSGNPRGSDFCAVLEAFTKTKIPMPASGRWANSGVVRSNGVDLAWCIYNAQYFGVPQRRRRIFAVADFIGRSAGEVLFVPKSLSGYFEARRAQGQNIADYAPRGTDGTSIPKNVTKCINGWDVQSRRIHKDDGIWPALYSGEWVGHGYVASEKICKQDRHTTGCITPWECQQSRVFATDGNAPTLAGADGGGGRNPGGLILAPVNEKDFCPVLNDQGGNSLNVEKTDISPTLRSELHGNAPVVTVRSAYPINTQLATRHNALGKGTGFGVADDGKPAYTLQEGRSHAVAVGLHQNQDGNVTVAGTAYTLTTSGSSSSRNAPLVCENIHAFSLDSDGSNSMKSNNPKSGCRETETVRTLDCTNPCPSKKQGGIAVVEVHPNVTGTLCASGAGLSRPGGLASETDLCVALSVEEAIPISDKATRYKGGGDTRNDDGSGNGLGVGKSGAPAPTLTSADRHAVAAFCLQGNIVGRAHNNGPNGSGITEDKSCTLTATDVAAVAAMFKEDVHANKASGQSNNSDDIVCNKTTSVDCRNFTETVELSGTLQAKGSQGYSLNTQNPIRTAYVVRRLLPTECELLMGFPTGWTEFGHDGKTISDTRRYQMLGNSIVVHCIAYILQGISQVFKDEDKDYKENAEGGNGEL